MARIVKMKASKSEVRYTWQSQEYEYRRGKRVEENPEMVEVGLAETTEYNFLEK